MGDNDIIAATIKISNLRALSNTQIADEIRIFVDQYKKMMFYIIMDEAVKFKILVDIENYQQTN